MGLQSMPIGIEKIKRCPLAAVVAPLLYPRCSQAFYQRGEISLMVYDLLGENANVRRNITETFIEDIQSNVLQRYVMLSFTYNLRRFSKGMDENAYNELYQDSEN